MVDWGFWLPSKKIHPRCIHIMRIIACRMLAKKDITFNKSKKREVIKNLQLVSHIQLKTNTQSSDQFLPMILEVSPVRDFNDFDFFLFYFDLFYFISFYLILFLILFYFLFSVFFYFILLKISLLVKAWPQIKHERLPWPLIANI